MVARSLRVENVLMSYWSAPRDVRRLARKVLIAGEPNPSHDVNSAALGWANFGIVFSLSITLLVIIAGVVEGAMIGGRASISAPVAIIMAIPATRASRQRNVLRGKLRLLGQ